MKKRLFLFAALAVCLLVCVAMKPTPYRAKTDKENVVASRLEGEWLLHVPLTKRLFGPKYKLPRAYHDRYISFKTDPAIVQEIPEKYHEFLGNKTIYMAGMMHWERKDHPFILIEHSGNPYLVYFQERDGHPMGDAECFNLILAPGTDKINDLLFIGGDFNNSPFKAYERKQKSSAMNSAQAKTFLNLMEAVKTSNLELFKSVYSDRMKAYFEKHGWDAALKKCQNECSAGWGEFELEDFELFFDSYDQPGILRIEFKGKHMDQFPLIQENGQWKIDDH